MTYIRSGFERTENPVESALAAPYRMADRFEAYLLAPEDKKPQLYVDHVDNIVALCMVVRDLNERIKRLEEEKRK